jgi:hypothetical protein
MLKFDSFSQLPSREYKDGSLYCEDANKNGGPHMILAYYNTL